MIYIHDTITSKASNSYLFNLILNQAWVFSSKTASVDELVIPYSFSWMNSVYDSEFPNHSNLKSLTESILISHLSNLGIEYNQLLRIRIGFITRTPETIVHKAHTDYPIPHMTALYYVNDSDGDTILYNGTESSNIDTSNYTLDLNEKHNNVDLSIKTRVEPKADRMVIFNGARYHSSSTPTKNDFRIVITYNWR